MQILHVVFRRKNRRKRSNRLHNVDICGHPFDDSFWENADDKDETYTIIPKNTNKLKKFKEFEKLYSKQIKDQIIEQNKRAIEQNK